MTLFQTGPQRYQPTEQGGDVYARINQRALTLVVGIVAVGLPVILYLASYNPVIATCFRFSISHFYYAPFWGSAFTGALVFIGAYMIVYRGEDAEGAENKLSTYGGIAAFGIALFPTDGWGCDAAAFTARPMTEFDLPPGATTPVLLPGQDAQFFELFPFSSTIHYLSAIFLFGFLAWFALFVFTAVEDHQRRPDGGLKQTKIIRNAFYYVAGGTIIFCTVALLLYALLSRFTSIDMSWWNRGNWTFWFEAIALLAFGLSWLVKGRFINWLRDNPDIP